MLGDADRPLTSAPVIAGVDGCRGGWLVVAQSADQLAAWIGVDIDDVLDTLPPTAVIAIDIPIGLTERGARTCDIEARRRLGSPRSSSVFSAPVRGVLDAETHADACVRHRAIDGRGLSIQAFAIMPKILEVDRSLRRHAQRATRVVEVHPEVSFALWNGGRPMAHGKTQAAGREEREALIQQEWPRWRPALWERLKGGVAADDLNDAFAALWTARRLVDGVAVSFPEEEHRDAFGLPMRILA